MRSRFQVCLGVLVLLTVAVALRWPSLPREVWNLDEANTCVFAQHILQGDLMYRDAVDTRGPLMVYLLAAELRVLGSWNLTGLHLALAAMLGLTAILLWRMAARFGNSGVGAWTAAAFTLASLLFVDPIDAFTTHTEWFVVFFSTLGFYLIARAWRSPSAWLTALAGASFGLAYLAKQPGLFDAVTAVVWIGCFVVFDPEARRIRLKLLGALATGWLAVAAGAPLYFWAHGALREYQFYVWTYSTRYYLPEVTGTDHWIGLAAPFALAWRHLPWFAAAAIVAVAMQLHSLGRSLRTRLAGQEIPLLALGWSIAGVLASGLGGRAFDHYCIQAIPGFSLLTGWTLNLLWTRAGTAASRRTALLWGGLALLPVMLGTARAVHRLATLELASEPAQPVGEIIRASTRPEDRIFVWGFYPEINYYAQRLNAARFASANFLTGLIPWTNLDPDKDTAYAIVPGAWDELWTDFERHPPAVIVDSNTYRGYAKYPLARQGRLWEYVQDHYVEIETDQVRPRGFRLYRRTGKPLTGPTEPAPDPALAVQREFPNGAPTSSFPIRLPAGFTAAEFLVNGHHFGAIPLIPDRRHELMFVYRPAVHGQNPVIVVHARRSNGDLVAGPPYTVPDLPAQPAIIDGPIELPAIVSECLTGPLTWLPKEKVFSAHAPARLVFLRPRALLGVSFEFGLFDGAWAPERKPPTDGIELQVEFTPDHGKPRRLVTQAIYPQTVPADRGHQSVKVDLPPGETGRLEIVLSPGRHGDASSDWAYIGPIHGRMMPLTLSEGSNHWLAATFDAPLGVAEIVEGSQLMVLAHAPAMVEFELRPGMRSLSGDFCLAQSSWQNPKGHTAGIDFIAELVALDGRITELWRQRLEPAGNPTDRGVHHFRFALPAPATGRVRLRSAAAHPPDNSYGYSCWANLAAHVTP